MGVDSTVANSILKNELDTEKLTASKYLHANGWVELGKLPDWEVFDMVEGYFAEYHDLILRLLDRERPRWFEDVEEYEVRPGSVIAKELSKRFEQKGIWISAVHPSESDNESLGYPITGPRFYISVMQAAMRRGPAPPPPLDVAHMLWPEARDRKKPWITEVGWTLVPPGSDAQEMHADILSYEDKISDPREMFLGRFHHFIWKPDRTTNCTTGVVTAGFTNGKLQDWMYSNLHRVSSPTVVLDSEVCHCGGPTGPEKWTSSCTVQLCSSTGWTALQSRASPHLLEYTCPIDFGFSGPWHDLPEERQLKTSNSHKLKEDRRIRQGGKFRWSEGSLVEIKLDGEWVHATISRRNLDASYRVQVDRESSFRDGVPNTNIRARRWALGSDIEVKWHGDWHPARVRKVRNDWTYRVHYDADGTCSHLVDHCDIRSRNHKKRSRSESSSDVCIKRRFPRKFCN